MSVQVLRLSELSLGARCRGKTTDCTRSTGVSAGLGGTRSDILLPSGPVPVSRSCVASRWFVGVGPLLLCPPRLCALTVRPVSYAVAHVFPLSCPPLPPSAGTPGRTSVWTPSEASGHVCLRPQQGEKPAILARCVSSSRRTRVSPSRPDPNSGRVTDASGVGATGKAE